MNSNGTQTDKINQWKPDKNLENIINDLTEEFIQY